MPDEYLVRYLHYTEAVAQTILTETWLAILRDRLAQDLFYDGKVRTLEDFQKLILRPGCVPFAVYVRGELAMFTWLNQISGKTARSHFVVFRNFWGRKKRIALGLHVYRHILNLEDRDGTVFDCLYGITPASHKLAVKAVLASGWVECGRIPEACYLAKQNRQVDGIITCATREILEKAQ